MRVPGKLLMQKIRLDFFKYIILGIFFLRIFFSYVPILPFTPVFLWSISPTDAMFTLPKNTTVETRYLLINTKTQSSVDLLKIPTKSFLYENQTTVNLIGLILQLPFDHFLFPKASMLLQRQICLFWGKDIHEKFQFRVIEKDRSLFEMEFQCR